MSNNTYERAEECKHCKRPRVKITRPDGSWILVHDDGSFVDYLGESEGGA